MITIDGIETTNVGISTINELCLFLCPSVNVIETSGAMPYLMCFLSISAREYGYAIISDLIIILFSCTRVTVYDIFIIYVADPIYTIWSSFGLSSTSIMHDPYIILTIVFIFNIIAVFTSKLSVMIAILYHSTCVSGTLSLLSYSSHLSSLSHSGISILTDSFHSTLLIFHSSLYLFVLWLVSMLSILRYSIVLNITIIALNY